MSKHCCGGHGSNGPLGWDGKMFFVSIYGLLGCKMLDTFSPWKQLASNVAWFCGGLLIISVVAVCWNGRPKPSCDHDHEAHE